MDFPRIAIKRSPEKPGSGTVERTLLRQKNIFLVLRFGGLVRYKKGHFSGECWPQKALPKGFLAKDYILEVITQI